MRLGPLFVGGSWRGIVFLVVDMADSTEDIDNLRRVVEIRRRLATRILFKGLCSMAICAVLFSGM